MMTGNTHERSKVAHTQLKGDENTYIHTQINWSQLVGESASQLDARSMRRVCVTEAVYQRSSQ